MGYLITSHDATQAHGGMSSCPEEGMPGILSKPRFEHDGPEN